MKQRAAHFLDGRSAYSDASDINVDQIRPSMGYLVQLEILTTGAMRQAVSNYKAEKEDGIVRQLSYSITHFAFDTDLH
jgi:hypothetical protein